MAESADEYETMTEACCLCEEPMSADSSAPEALACLLCKAPMHGVCRGLWAQSKKPTADMKAASKQPWFAVLCDQCLASRKARDKADLDNHPSLREMREEMKEIRESLSAIAAVVGPEVPAGRKSYANAAAQPAGLASSGLLRTVSKAVSKATEDEVSRRSVVIDGVPLEDGESDLEKVEGFIRYCGLANTVRVNQVYRMGKVSETGHPQKIKVVLAIPGMQTQLLNKEVRELARAPTCPEAFSNAFINPSRTLEQRRLLAKLRHRRNELNGKIEDEDSQWFVHYGRCTLVKKEAGTPDWNGPGDAGWEAWEAAWDKANPIHPKPTAPAPGPAKPKPHPSRPRTGLKPNPGNH